MIKAAGREYPLPAAFFVLVCIKQNIEYKNPATIEITGFSMAGEEGFEPSAYGFGDRRSTN